MSRLVLVDTGIFVDARDARKPEKREQARARLQALWESKRGRVNLQVLNDSRGDFKACRRAGTQA